MPRNKKLKRADRLRPKISSVSVNAYLFAILIKALKFYLTVDRCEERVIGALLNVVAGVDLGASLSYEDIARKYVLSVGTLNSESLGFAVASVLGGTHTFFMSKELQT